MYIQDPCGNCDRAATHLRQLAVPQVSRATQGLGTSNQYSKSSKRGKRERYVYEYTEHGKKILHQPRLVIAASLQVIVANNSSDHIQSAVVAETLIIETSKPESLGSHEYPLYENYCSTRPLAFS